MRMGRHRGGGGGGGGGRHDLRMGIFARKVLQGHTHFYKAMPIFRCIVSSLYCGLVCIEGYILRFL